MRLGETSRIDDLPASDDLQRGPNSYTCEMRSPLNPGVELSTSVWVLTEQDAPAMTVKLMRCEAADAVRSTTMI